MRALAKHLGFVLLPPRCLLCNAPGLSASDICAACREDLPWLARACSRCALPLANAAALCGGCLQQPPPFAAAFAAFRYTYPLDVLIRRFKFQQDLVTGRVLSELFASGLAARLQTFPDLIVPVPLHQARLRTRGFNQAGLLANAAAAACGVAADRTLVERVRDTQEQSGKSAAARRRNVRNAFAVTRKPPRHVVIVDDVVTTGSTVREIARCLKRAGTRRIDVWALARTP